MAAAAAGEAILDSIRPLTNGSSHPSYSLSDEQLSMLHFLYGKNLERAMRILDQNGVYRIVGEPSKRVVFQVVGESKNSEKYLCFPKHFCSCHSFFFDVVGRGEQLSCKHQLAARIAEALEIRQHMVVPDEKLAILLFIKVQSREGYSCAICNC
ncbi:hypothetical protein KP509_23G041100 [Ceratopteris richardii]|uniref:SWIM-type domain-containing protein n=1 Tax=Ceratopteris richardii TaxID=49495 RepID=A0A8T2RZ77_CERRI|nr:hypothetical protein KP509_23G041100 [Ceratopteris richardii]